MVKGSDNIAYIYKIVNKINDKFYIGSTNNFKRRKIQHIWGLKNNSHPNNYLQNAWNKYGEENFYFEIIEECKDDEQFIREQYYLDKYKTYMPMNGYNIESKTVPLSKTQEYKNNILSNKNIVFIKKMLVSGVKIEKIAKDFDVQKELIYGIKNLSNWSNIGKKYNENLMAINESEKLSLRELNTIDRLLKMNFTYREISKIFEMDLQNLKYQYEKNEARKENKTDFCERCGKEFIKNSNAQKYCKECLAYNKKLLYKSLKKPRKKIDKQKLLDENKSLIIDLFINKNETYVKIIKRLNIVGLTNSHIKLAFKRWGIKID